MARINIEDSLFKEDGFLSLIEKTGNRYMALGMVVSAFSLAQKHWLKHKSIPEAEWPSALNMLVETGLVINKGNSFYVKGSEDAFAWLERNSKGGKSKSEKKMSSLKKARNNKAKALNLSRTKAEPDLNLSEDLTLPLILTLPPILSANSISSSNSDSNSNSVSLKRGSENSKSEKAPTKVVAPLKYSTANLIATYCDNWKKVYKSSINPMIDGKSAKLLKNFLDHFGKEKSELVVNTYFKMPDKWFLTKKHDIATMLGNTNSIIHFLETGRVVTATELLNIEKKVTNENILEALRNGEI